MTDHVPRDCPKYDNCSVPLCPLDRDWRVRAVNPQEPVCPYLLELDKPGDPVARFAALYDEFVIKAAVQLCEDLIRVQHPRYNFLAGKIAYAADTPTMIEQKASRAKRFKRALEDKKKRSTPSGDRTTVEEPPHQATPLPPGGV